MTDHTMHELATQSFDLVNRELASTLETARGEIEDYIDGQSNSEALVRAASMLHLAAGALKIVEIHGAALLAEEMERTCRHLHETGVKDESDQSIEALTRAMVQLPAYLDRLLSGGSDVALVLLPLLNDLRSARGQPLLSEGTLLLLNTGPFERLRAAAVPDQAATFDNDEVPALAQKLRPAFQAALLGWIRGDDVEKNLAELIKVSDQLEHATESEPVRQLWAVTAGVLTALKSEAIESTVALKRLIGQADRQLKRLIDSGEKSFVSAPPVELLNSLLYYVARAPSDDPRIVELRRTFGVEATMPDEEAIERARENLAGPSVKLMRTVAQAIKEDLGGVKDVLDIFVRTGMENVADLKPQIDMLKKIGDTLGVLGLEPAMRKIQSETDRLAAIVEQEQIDDPTVLERVAATLLDVEDLLDRELVDVLRPEADAEANDEDALESNQYRHVTQAVMRECIVNLAKIKEAVVKVVDDPTGLRVLDQVGPQLRGIVAGLLMLNKNRAVNVIERIGRIVTTRLTPDSDALKPSLIERLADAIVSIEYYMETVALGRADPLYMLDNANRCLDVLERVPEPAKPKLTAAPGSDGSTEKRPPRLKPAEKAASLSVMEVDEERSEPELVEIFIDEAKEEIANVRRNLPRWIEQPQDSEALISVRRSFHTLKGSGRMVGAQLLAEVAWAIENLCNRIINKTLQPNPDIREFIEEAVGFLPELIEQLEIGIKPEADVAAMIGRAFAFADMEPDEGTSLAVRQIGPESGEAAAAGQPMDPVLQQIFVKEVRAHLKTIRDYIERICIGSPPFAVEESVYRATHTLYGSAKMASCAAAIELARPVEAYVRQKFEAGDGIGAEALALLGRYCDEMERLVAALESGESFAASAELAASLVSLGAPAADGEPVAAASMPDRDEPASEPELLADSYDPEIAAIFCDEAGDLLDQAETALQVMKSSPGAEAEVAELKRLLHTLKGGARMAGILPMGDLSHALETILPGIASTQDPQGLQLAQAGLDRLQQMRDAIEANQPVAAAADLLAQFAAFSGEPVAADLPVARGPDGGDIVLEASGLPDAVTDEAEIEPEIPDAAAAARDEIGYGVAPGDEAAAVTEADSGDYAVPADTDQAHAEAQHGEAASETEPGIELEIDPESGPEIEPEPRPESETAGAAISGADEPAMALATGESAAPDVGAEAGTTVAGTVAAVRAPPDEEAGVDTSDRDERSGASAAEPARATSEDGPRAASPAPRVERAETARVDSALLDELLNAAGEISIFQSRLNQQVHSVEFHLRELGQTVTRLREQLRSLEAETEAQILHRHQGDAADDEQFDPLELDRYSTIQQLSRALAETSSDVASINELLQGLTSEADTLLTQQSRVTTELQDGLMQTRMVSFDRHASRLARIVRQAAQDSGKQAELAISGATSQLDRQILEAVIPALEHLLRNAVVHGIEMAATRRAAGKPEEGTISLNVRREGSEVLIEVADDGAGLNFDAIRRIAVERRLVREGETVSDEDAIELILRPGFSTAGELTQTAGRGVGMDVVDNDIKRLGGSLRIDTEAGKGTRFLIRLPYTLAITHALIVNVGDETFALPLPTVEGIARVRRDQLLEMLTEDEPRLTHGDGSYRIQHLGGFVGASPSALPEDESAVSLVLVRAGDNSTALLTDSLEGSREIIVKTLGPHVASVPGVSGATILGDGRVVVILDAATLVRTQASESRLAAAPVPDVEEQALSALVVDDSITMRRVTQRLLERRGVRVLTARDGLDAIEVLREQEADIILLDVEMPRMDGYQFATHVRNDDRLKELPIIMITSRSGEKHRARAIEIGVNDYLSKPYQEADLVAAIEALVGRSL